MIPETAQPQAVGVGLCPEIRSVLESAAFLDGGRRAPAGDFRFRLARSTMLSFALKTLTADRGKLATGLAGVVFSLVLVNVQGGLYLGLMQKASLLIDHCDADIWVGNQMVENVDLARDIPETWINRLRGITGVDCVNPYSVGKGTGSPANGPMEAVGIIGSDPASMLGSGWAFVEGPPNDLKRPDAISFDEVDAPKLGHPHVGDWLEVNGHRTQIVARTRGITGFITMPYLFTTFETARRMSNIAPGACSFLLLKIGSGESLNRVLATLPQRLPHPPVFTPRQSPPISHHYRFKPTQL